MPAPAADGTPPDDPPTGDDLLAALLATGLSYKDAGKKAGVSEATVYRRMRDGGLREKVAGMRREAVWVALNRITAAVVDAVDELHRQCTGGEKEEVRVRAADLLLDYYLKFEERHDLQDRIARLEALTARTPVPDTPAARPPADAV